MRIVSPWTEDDVEEADEGERIIEVLDGMVGFGVVAFVKAEVLPGVLTTDAASSSSVSSA